MGYIKQPGTTVIVNPFYFSSVKHCYVYLYISNRDLVLKDSRYTIYADIDGTDCFMASSPYPSYRIQEYDILLTPEPSTCYCNGILWKSDDYFMFIDCNGAVVITRGLVPGELLTPEESFREMEYWKSDQASIGLVNAKSLTGRHPKESAKNITVVKEFPRWVRRLDSNNTYNINNLPYGYYDPVDGADGVLRVGELLKNTEGSKEQWRGEKEAMLACLGEIMTWRQ